MTLETQSIRIDDDVIGSLMARLSHVRRPTPKVRAPWSDGIDPALVSALIERWRGSFDWRRRELLLNRYGHVFADIDGIKLHAMVSKPDSPAETLPLLALHGWPSTFEQMTRLADELTTPGGAMTVVAPSLPGFGFSTAPTDPDWDLARVARAMHTLMVDRFGYGRYLVRGTDYGLAVALHLGALFPEHVAGVHIGGTHLTVPDNPDLPDDLSDEERAFVAEARRWYDTEGGYVAIQETKPETLAWALSDSPAGLLAWITEKYRTWCATPDNLHATFSQDDLLSTATIYWGTNTIASSMRLYREDLLGSDLPRSVAPVAVSQPELEEYAPPQSWWRRSQPVVRYTSLAGAAHFPEWEAPRALAADIRAFARDLSREVHTPNAG